MKDDQEKGKQFGLQEGVKDTAGVDTRPLMDEQ